MDSLNSLEQARRQAQEYIKDNVQIFFDDFGSDEDAVGAFVMSIEEFNMMELKECRQALALTLTNFTPESRQNNPLVMFYEKCLNKVDDHMDKIRK